ncbi:Undecaprenyl-phosphate 4-deoxy-4-formamido-L-arabinose transferase [anaerobic digester metagenome]
MGKNANITLSIIVPVYNEAGNINPLLEEIQKTLMGIAYEVIFVDDSIDETPMVIRKAAEKYPVKIQLEHRENKKGLATAVVRGFELASGDIFAVMDADMQHPPEILLPMYCAMMNNADICIPSRFIPGGGDGGLNLWRKFISFVARQLGKIAIYNLRQVSDVTSGIFMIKRSVINKNALHPIGWKICVEIMAVSVYSRIIQIPYVFDQRNDGKSKLSHVVTLQYLRQLFDLIPRMTKNKNIKVETWTLKKMNDEILKFKNRKENFNW